MEDISWLRPKDDGAHINIAELDALLKGLKMALKWQRRIISIRCDSVSVCKWVESVISGDKRIRAKGISEALVGRRLWLIQQTI